MHSVEFPVPYSMFPLVVYFIHIINTAYVSTPISQFHPTSFPSRALALEIHKPGEDISPLLSLSRNVYGCLSVSLSLSVLVLCFITMGSVGIYKSVCVCFYFNILGTRQSLLDDLCLSSV